MSWHRVDGTVEERLRNLARCGRVTVIVVETGRGAFVKAIWMVSVMQDRGPEVRASASKLAQAVLDAETKVTAGGGEGER